MHTAQHIVTSALKLFQRHGFHASGVDLLSQEAGVTKKTLYRHFDSKDSLIAAALKLRHEQFMAKMKAYVESASVENRPLAYIDFIASWVQEEDYYGCTFINATAEFSEEDAPPHAMAASHKQEIGVYLQSVCMAAGTKSPFPVSRQLFLIGEGLIVASQVLGHAASDIDGAKKLAHAIWHAAIEPDNPVDHEKPVS